MLDNSLTLGLVNNSAQNLLRNLGSLSVIRSLSRPQSIKSNYLKNIYAYYFVDQILIPLIRMTYFKNLHITNIIVLKLYLENEGASRNSSINKKIGIGEDSIGCSNL